MILNMPKGNRKRFQKKKLPMASKKVDQSQNKAIDNLSKKLKSLEGDIEVKHITQTFTATNFAAATAATQIILVNPVAQGDDYNERIGDKIKMTSFQIKGVIVRQNADLGKQTARMILVYDAAPKGAALTFGEVLDLGGVAAGLTPYAPYNLDYVGSRIKILYDKSWVLNPQVPDGWVDAAGIITVSGYAPVQKLIKANVPIGRVANYGLGTAGAVASIATGSLYLLFMSTESLGAGTTTYQFDGLTRLFYRDL